MPETINIHGLHISNVTMEEVLADMERMLLTDRLHTVFTPNAEIIMQSIRDQGISDLLNGADLLLPDGAGVVLGSKILGTPLREKVSGIDVAKRLMALKRKKGLRFYLFGGKPGIAEQAAIHMFAEYPGISIAGFHHGYFDESDQVAILEDINRTGVDILFVCLGAPKQEQWIWSHRQQLKCRIAIGLGGSLDVFAGTGKLAPEWMRRAGFEWLYRLVREPHRWKRMLDLPRFVLLTLRVRFAKDQEKS